MADTGWAFPGTTSCVSNKFTFVFANTDNVKLDNATASIAVGPKVDNNPPVNVPEAGIELITTNYGFSIPTGATITGVEAKIEGYTDNNRVGELAYLANPTYIGTSKNDEWTDMSTDNTTPTYGVHTYGGPTDLWGATLTPAIVNGTNFGWIFMIHDDVSPLQCGIDYMQIKVHYEELVLSTPPIIMMIGA